MAWTNDPLTNEIKITRIHIQEIRNKLDAAQEVECPIYCSGLHSTQELAYYPSFDTVKDDTIDITKYDTDDVPYYVVDDATLHTVENATNCPSYCPAFKGSIRAGFATYSGGCSGHYKSVLSAAEVGVNSSN